MRAQKKYLLIFLGVAFAGAGGHAAKLLWDAGVFKNLPQNSHEKKDCQVLGNIQGPEDIDEIPGRGFVISSSFHEPRYHFPKQSGALYFLAEKHLGTGNPPIKLSQNHLAEFHPHGIDTWSEAESDYVFVVNHQPNGDSLELFEIDWSSNRLVWLKSLGEQNSEFVRVNDVVAKSLEDIYTSHEFSSAAKYHMTASKFLRIPTGRIGHFKLGQFRFVSESLFYTNGLTYDKSQNHLYAAEMLGKRVQKFEILPDGNLQIIATLSLPSSPDNIVFDPHQDSLFIATHPQLLKLKSHSEDSDADLPASEIFEVNSNLSKSSLNRRFFDRGDIVAAASIGYPTSKGLILGTIYQDQLWLCPWKEQR